MTLRRTPMPPRTVRLVSRTPLRAVQPGDGQGSTLSRHAWLKPAAAGTGSRLAVVRVTPSTIPPDVLAKVDDRDGHFCQFCGLWREVIEHHHRRIKGMDGDTAPHTECPCNIVSACPWWAEPGCHRIIHAKRRLLAEPRGFIIPRATPFPGAIPVAITSREDGTVAELFATCSGRWVDYEPDGEAA